MKGKQRSVVMLTGYIQNDIKPKAGIARFSLRNQEGLFYIRVHGEVLARQCEQLQLGDKVTVVGFLSAFFNESCRGHHTILNIQAITPALDDPWLVGGIPFMVSRMYTGVFQHLKQGAGQAPESAVMITGRVNSTIQAREGVVHFSLGNGDGVFHIRTEGRLSAFCKQLRAGETEARAPECL